MGRPFLSRFTPSIMAAEVLEAIFVQRQELAERLVELIENSALTGSKQHTLLIGPRGIGKTHLVSLVYHRVRQLDSLRDRLIIAWLREEEWGVMSFLDLLLRILRALIAEDKNQELKDQVEGLYQLSSDEAERAAAALLKEYVARRTLLIIVENLDDLFHGLEDEGQKRLRSYLQENPFSTILATSQSLFGGVSLQTSPFYGFFRINYLEELTLADATQLLAKIAELEGDEDLASLIKTSLGRVRLRALHRLAGGNHRVYIIFSQFLTRESLNELIEALMRTLDELTPYYHERIRWLSPQQRKIVELLSDRGNALSVKEIASRCFMSHQTASAQLKSLREWDTCGPIRLDASPITNCASL
jgi:DNA-binding transcriptional ArsR family regulator